jgi:hypothetical protein
MSSNRNASQVTLSNKNAALAQYNSYFNNAVNTGNGGGAGSFSQGYGGNGGTGLVVLQYYA